MRSVEGSVKATVGGREGDGSAKEVGRRRNSGLRFWRPACVGRLASTPSAISGQSIQLTSTTERARCLVLVASAACCLSELGLGPNLTRYARRYTAVARCWLKGRRLYCPCGLFRCRNGNVILHFERAGEADADRLLRPREGMLGRGRAAAATLIASGTRKKSAYGSLCPRPLPDSLHRRSYGPRRCRFGTPIRSVSSCRTRLRAEG